MPLRRHVARTGGPSRVQLGPGPVHRVGWVQNEVWWRARYHLDATAWPFAPGSVSHVFADNVIEHVPLDGARCAAAQRLDRARARRPDPADHTRRPRLCPGLPRGGERSRAQLDAHRGAGTRVEHSVDILRGVFVEYGHRDGYA